MTWTRFRRGLLRGLAAGCLVGGTAVAGEIGDVLPFRIVHGRPSEEAGPAPVMLWSEGGRLKLRLEPRAGPGRAEGELRMSRGGVFKDVRPLSENLRVRMPTPETIRFDVELGSEPEGFDVVLSGDFSTLTVDLRVDGERRPTELAIGEHAERPQALPARLDLDEASASSIDRFGFR
jgi:hypothetical protein